jgi:biofilm protein TabA
MIADKIKNISLYTNISERIAKGLELLKDHDLINKADGKYEVDGDNIYYLVQRYKTKNYGEAKFEAHRNYIDIQAVLRGREIIGYTNIGNLKENVPYKTDVVFFETPVEFTEIKLTEGMFTLLFPDDGHMPACDYGGKNEVVKIVVKIKI